MTERRTEKAQRLRLRFARGSQAATVGHLDITHIWELAFDDAGIAVSYSQGNKPRPRLTLAAGLPMGVTSNAELLDAVLAEVALPENVLERVARELPEGLVALECHEVGMGLPSIPSAVRWADYEVDVSVADGIDVAQAVATFLAADEFAWEDTRGEKTRRYDIRPLVQDVRVEERCEDTVRLAMRLRCGTEGVGRPDQVVKALGLPEPSRTHRRLLLLAESSRARKAWRRRGRYLA